LAARLESGRILLNEIELRRFYSFCVVDLVTGCWNWTGATDPSGYGRFMLKLESWRSLPAYVVSYNHFVDVVPVGLELAHFNFPDGASDKCAFYEHVRPATHAENLADKVSSTCKYGHDVLKWGRNGSTCKVCSRLRRAGTYRSITCETCGYNPCRC